MLIIALKTLHNICKPQLYLNSKNLAKISPIAKVVMCMKYQINFTISYDLCCPYKWNQLEKTCLITILLSQSMQFQDLLSSLILAVQLASSQMTIFSSNIPPVLCGPLYSISVLPYNMLSSYAVLLKEPIHLLLIKYKFPAVNCSFQHIIFSMLWLNKAPSSCPFQI